MVRAAREASITTVFDPTHYYILYASAVIRRSKGQRDSNGKRTSRKRSHSKHNLKIRSGQGKASIRSARRRTGKRDPRRQTRAISRFNANIIDALINERRSLSFAFRSRIIARFLGTRTSTRVDIDR